MFRKCLCAYLAAVGCGATAADAGNGGPLDASTDRVGSASDASSGTSDASSASDVTRSFGDDAVMAPQDGSFPPDGSSSPADAAFDAAPDAGVPPFSDPWDGASGCPDGGHPLGRGPCAAAFPFSGYPSLDGVFQPIACGNNNDGYASVWFASDFGFGANTTNVHVYFSTPLAGMIGQLAVTVSVETPDGAFNQLTWSTAPGVCTVTLDTDVCWDFEQVQYYLVAGTGHCTAPATSAGDAGGSLTIGNFWFQTLSYP
jgi:hypothetical protein